jgi:hypothetical protein
MPTLLQAFAEALAFLPELLVFRCFPYALYASFSSRQSALFRVFAALTYLAAIALAVKHSSDYLPRLAAIAAGMLLYAAAGLAAHLLASALRTKRLTRGTAGALCAVTFLLPPLLHRELASSPTQALAWEYLLASYSYIVESARSGTRHTLRDCYFFLFLRQTLVFTHSNEELGPCESRLAGVGRILVGISALSIGLTLQIAGVRSALQALNESGTMNSYATAVICGLGLFFSEYLGHSGRASLTIGMMRGLGFRLPERYRYPFLALNPEDFWRRWNCYVTRWSRIYVYRPLTRVLAGKGPSKRQNLRSAGAVSMLATFALIGLLHDVDAASRPGAMLQLRWVPVFTLFATAVLAGNSIRRLYADASAARMLKPRLNAWSHKLLARTVMLQMIGCVAWFVLR